MIQIAAPARRNKYRRHVRDLQPFLRGIIEPPAPRDPKISPSKPVGWAFGFIFHRRTRVRIHHVPEFVVIIVLIQGVLVPLNNPDIDPFIKTDRHLRIKSLS